MFKEETVKRLVRENRVKLFGNMMIKLVPEISFTGEDDLFKKIRATFAESYGQDYNYCEIDFRADSNHPISFPDSFECIVTDNADAKDRVEAIFRRMNVTSAPHTYISAFPSYSGP